MAKNNYLHQFNNINTDMNKIIKKYPTFALSGTDTDYLYSKSNWIDKSQDTKRKINLASYVFRSLLSRYHLISGNDLKHIISRDAHHHKHPFTIKKPIKANMLYHYTYVPSGKIRVFSNISKSSFNDFKERFKFDVWYLQLEIPYNKYPNGEHINAVTPKYLNKKSSINEFWKFFILRNHLYDGEGGSSAEDLFNENLYDDLPKTDLHEVTSLLDDLRHYEIGYINNSASKDAIYLIGIRDRIDESELPGIKEYFKLAFKLVVKYCKTHKIVDICTVIKFVCNQVKEAYSSIIFQNKRQCL